MARLINEFGRDLGEIIETSWQDSSDDECEAYVVYVKKEEGSDATPS